VTTELERIKRFLDDTEEAVCDEARPVGCGTALLTPSLPSVWQLNAVRVEDTGAGPDDVAAEADEVLADRAHRQLFVPDSDQGAELASELARRGWNVVRLLVMVRRGEPDRDAPAGLGVEVDRAAGAAALAAFRREQALDGGAETIRQLEEMDERFTRAREGRDFASPPEDRYACCRLFAAEGVGQVDQVCTLEAHRNRGYARAAILAAVDAATAAGLDPVFLLADAEEWPQHLYRRLGFEAVDMQWEFLKLPLRSSPP
jgi:GNAT superfamily N-acetyltransferase